MATELNEATCYEILEVSESATIDEIRSAHRRLVNQYHPDKLGLGEKEGEFPWIVKEAVERYSQINEAWAVLGDEEKRKQYDDLLREQRGQTGTYQEPEDSFSGASYSSPAGTSAQSSTSPPPPPPTSTQSSSQASQPPPPNYSSSASQSSGSSAGAPVSIPVSGKASGGAIAAGWVCGFAFNFVAGLIVALILGTIFPQARGALPALASIWVFVCSICVGIAVTSKIAGNRPRGRKALRFMFFGSMAMSVLLSAIGVSGFLTASPGTAKSPPNQSTPRSQAPTVTVDHAGSGESAQTLLTQAKERFAARDYEAAASSCRQALAANASDSETVEFCSKVDSALAAQATVSDGGDASSTNGVEASGTTGTGKGTVQIHTEPNASVSLDGRSIGQADATGLLTASDLLPGPHALSIQKEGFQPFQQSFKLADRESRDMSAPMNWAGSLLTITAQPQTASISVRGPASFSGPLNSARCPPGNYTVEVSQNGYTTQTRSFVVSANEPHQEHFELNIDTNYIGDSLKGAEGALAGGDADSALRSAEEVYSLDPSNGRTAKVMAEAHFAKGDAAGSFIKYGIAAIQRNEPISIAMMHVRNFPKRAAQGAVITISKGDLEFQCVQDAKCPMPKSVAYDQIYNLSAMNDVAGTPVLHITYSDHPHGTIVHDLDFVPTGSTVVKEIQQPGAVFSAVQSILRIPPNSGDQYREIIQLINNVRR